MNMKSDKDIVIPQVMNLKSKEDFNSETDVYIGRGSKWGNKWSHIPFSQAECIVDTREEAIAKYEEWIKTQPDLIAAAKIELKSKRLFCHCYPPNPCHGFILLKIANE